jgi:hypothetical protein
MAMTAEGLSLGNISFNTIIDNHLLYADKTKYIYELLESHNESFFLSRPRRFGKTLLLRTIKELCTGDRERFKGLWIGQSDYSFIYHPVIYLSMPMESHSPQILRNNIVNSLHTIANNARLDIPVATPGAYLASIVNSLYQSTNSKVVVLIDEYDAPVTTNMADMTLAKDNAKILHDFFAVLKDVNVSDCIHFTLVTGITRYALTSMDSGPNHLIDISLNPQYAGICGFTIDEFDSLFFNHMESTLLRLKESGVMPPASDSTELKRQIFKWYDGYNWGGQTRVLNPYSILNFFYNDQFGPYWIQSGRPGHLTALIQRRPMDFIAPSLSSYLETELKKTSLNQLQAFPVLFHCGYLTLDTVINSSVTDDDNANTVVSYTFKLPNYELNNSYLTDCFCSIFDIKPDELTKWGTELKLAFLAKDAETVTQKFKQYLSTNTYYQRLDSEKIFHIFVTSILSCMGFKVLSEVSGPIGRLDISIELPNSIFVIIELKYLQHRINIDSKIENSIVYLYSNKIFSDDECYKFIRNAIISKIGLIKVANLCITNNVDLNNSIEQNRFISSISDQFLTQTEIEETIAVEVRRTLSKDEVEQIIRLESHKKLSKDQIDAKLTKAAEEALVQIEERDYHGPFTLRAKKFIDLALVLYGDGVTIKAAFGAN